MQVEVQVILLLHLQLHHGLLQQNHLELLLEIFLEQLQQLQVLQIVQLHILKQLQLLTNASQANCALNSSTGAITTTDFGGSSTNPTTYNFTLRITDAEGQTTDTKTLV